jgi:hypothetical protein
LRWSEIRLLKHFQDAPGPEMLWGNRVHQAIAKTLNPGAPLPDEMLMYQKWIDKVKSLPGKIYVEQKYAINKDFQPTTYFADDVWYRGIGDVVKVGGTRAAILDWKTGKIKVDSVQLMLMAQCVFSHFPEVEKVHTGFVWLKEDCTTPEEFTRQAVADQWPSLLERVASMKNAYDTDDFPPKPSGLCKRHCPVTTCKYHGKGAFG